MYDTSRTSGLWLFSVPNNTTCATTSRGATNIVASFVAAAISVAETTAAGAMKKIEDGSLCCTDVEEDGCCRYCCYIDFETRL